MIAPKSIVLVVEDEEDSRESLRELLELEGYLVRTATNGREALAALAVGGDKICIVLLDLFMPVMDGWQVVEQLRSEGRLATTNIVIITSASHRAPAGIPVFEKPLDFDKVMSAVQRLC
jgi:CheY-like chemotaxis protein